MSCDRKERDGSVVARIEFIALLVYGVTSMGAQSFGVFSIHPDGVEYFMENLCHGLPTRFEDLACDTIDAGGLPVLYFLKACSICSREMGGRSSASSGGRIFRLLRWAGAETRH